MELNLTRIILPLTLVFWLFFELVEFFRLGGAGQPLAWCIVKISVITSTIIGLSTEKAYINSINAKDLIESFKTLQINSDLAPYKREYALNNITNIALIIYENI